MHRVISVVRKNPLLWLLGAVTFVDRVATAASVRGTFFSTGQQIYDAVAENVLNGHGFTHLGQPYVENPPVYPLTLVAAFGIGGHTWWPVAVMQALFDVGSLVLLYLLARRLFGQVPALVACVLYALYPYLAAQSAILMDTSLFVLTLVGFLYLLTRVADTGSWKWAAGAGLCAAVAFLVRPPVLIVIVAAPLLLAVLGAGRRALWRTTAVVAGVFVLALVPWTVRNAVEFNAFIPGSAKTGANLYSGNSPHAAEFITKGKSTDLLLGLPDAPKPPKSYDQVKRDNWWLHRSLDWIQANPGAWAHVLKVKLEAFWSWNLNPRTHGDTRLKKVLYTGTYLPLLVVALLSLARAIWPRRRLRELGFVAVVLGAFTLVHVAVVGYTRVRAPLDPLLMALAASLLVDLALVVHSRRSLPVRA